MKVNPKIEKSWFSALKDEFQKDYFIDLKQFLIKEKQNHEVYPPGEKIFSAFDKCPYDKLKVVIIGQDPYHGPDQANGLAFSVNEGISRPPSLQNIYKEIQNDLGIEMGSSGDLGKWAEQGILLLNTTLTVRKGQAGSHKGQGWEEFTDSVIKTISENKSGIIFLLWGNYAKEKNSLIDKNKHYILEAAHPSPFSANRGFFGCKHFSRVNEILKNQGKKEIIRKI
ncbi:uracil-DNA glycosylase [Candidatus Absconditicoccus praedator]|uniref:uracil-DNA glycosylase n=1 Tax=Candidatus Absconditicoccus praedator TaxID=2735562 RepID=UPI001E458BA6|nr:uracil-DNA glycosylase [Candidatus Absconditicoccus praedator]UFX83136.1 uracil-DNA glycosylase [Candidatus Absconditicoccus praedator]